MKVHLRVEMVVSDEYVTPDGSDLPIKLGYMEMNKEFDLPFAPFPGLRIQFPCLASTDSAAPPEPDASGRPPVLVTGVFQVADVLFRPEQRWPRGGLTEEAFYTRAFKVYDDPETLAAAAEALEAEYGFERDVMDEEDE